MAAKKKIKKSASKKKTAKQSAAQKKTTERVMHEYKHGELKSGNKGQQGKAGGGKVKSRKQAIAIALSEAGSSNTKSPAKNKKTLAKTKRKESTGKTAKQRKEGRL